MNQWRHLRSLTLICVVCTAAAVFGHIFLPLVHRWESEWRDSLVRFGDAAPRSPELMYLAIDQESMLLDLRPELIEASPALRLMKQQWPWSRRIYPMILDQLFEEGARIVALDVLFLTESPDDAPFRAALEKYRDRVVIGANVGGSVREGFETTNVAVPSESLISPASAFDDRVGFVNFWPDEYGVVRGARYRLTMSELAGVAPAPGEPRLFSLASRILQKLGMADRIPEGKDEVLFRFAGPPYVGFPKKPLYELFLPQDQRSPDLPAGVFRDKVVLVAPEGNFFHDEHRTPFRRFLMPGPELHLNALNAALRGELLTKSEIAANVAHIFLAGVLAWLLGFLVQRPLVRFALIALAGVGLYLAALAFYNYADRYTLVLSPMVALASSSVLFLVWEQVRERFERARTRRTLERYVSKNVVKELLDNPATYFNSLGGVRRPVTVLFTDLRGFTTLTESADSEALVAQLNEYFSAMVAHIFANGGTLDKFMGDAIMAVWGNIQSSGLETDVRNAVEAGLLMRDSLHELNERWVAEGKPALGMGIGINHGEAIVGNMGSDQKMELTVIGDTVNLGSRLEGLTKEYQLEILLGEQAAELAEASFHVQCVDSVRVKGKTKPVQIFTVLGRKAEPLEDSLREYLAVFADALEAYRGASFAKAVALFERCEKLRPGDPLATIHRERSRSLMENPPDEAWDGVFVMKTK